MHLNGSQHKLIVRTGNVFICFYLFCFFSRYPSFFAVLFFVVEKVKTFSKSINTSLINE